jgi:hypothetical protein
MCSMLYDFMLIFLKSQTLLSTIDVSHFNLKFQKDTRYSKLCFSLTKMVPQKIILFIILNLMIFHCLFMFVQNVTLVFVLELL